MPTPQAHQARTLAHYIDFAAKPGWKAYVWAQVQQMARDCPDLYATLPTDLTQAMQQESKK